MANCRLQTNTICAVNVCCWLWSNESNFRSSFVSSTIGDIKDSRKKKTGDGGDEEEEEGEEREEEEMENAVTGNEGCSGGNGHQPSPNRKLQATCAQQDKNTSVRFMRN